MKNAFYNLFFLALLIWAGSYIAEFIATQYSAHISSRNWISVKGQIVAYGSSIEARHAISKTGDHPYTCATPHANYVYVVNGVSHQGSQLYIGDETCIDPSRVPPHHAREIVDVFYDPHDVEHAALIPGPASDADYTTLVMVTFFFFLLTYILWDSLLKTNGEQQK